MSGSINCNGIIFSSTVFGFLMQRSIIAGYQHFGWKC